MDKREALKILLDHTNLLDIEVRRKIRFSIDKMTDEEVETIGKFLADAKKASISTFDEEIANIDEILKRRDD